MILLPLINRCVSPPGNHLPLKEKKECYVLIINANKYKIFSTFSLAREIKNLDCCICKCNALQ